MRSVTPLQSHIRFLFSKYRAKFYIYCTEWKKNHWNKKIEVGARIWIVCCFGRGQVFSSFTCPTPSDPGFRTSRGPSSPRQCHNARWRRCGRYPCRTCGCRPCRGFWSQPAGQMIFCSRPMPEKRYDLTVYRLSKFTPVTAVDDLLNPD